MEITEHWLKEKGFTWFSQVLFTMELPVNTRDARTYIDVINKNNKWLAFYRVNGVYASNEIDTVEGIVLLVNAVMRGGKEKIVEPYQDNRRKKYVKPTL